jgi:hypothetical protein
MKRTDGAVREFRAFSPRKGVSRMSRAKDIPFVGMIVFLVYLIPQSAYAYLDATTGSYALQTALGAVFAVLFYGRGAWNWIHRRTRAHSTDSDH